MLESILIGPVIARTTPLCKSLPLGGKVPQCAHWGG